MYAITSNGYRAINSVDELRADESIVDAIPPGIVSAIAKGEGRAKRNSILRSCDWTQMTDAPLTGFERAAWAAYRQALRDLPATPSFPDCEWPAPPGAIESGMESGANGD